MQPTAMPTPIDAVSMLVRPSSSPSCVLPSALTVGSTMPPTIQKIADDDDRPEQLAIAPQQLHEFPWACPSETKLCFRLGLRRRARGESCSAVIVPSTAMAMHASEPIHIAVAE